MCSLAHSKSYHEHIMIANESDVSPNIPKADEADQQLERADFYLSI